MEEGSSEGVSLSPATQKICCVLRSPTYHYRPYEGPPHVVILSQINPLHVLSPYFCDTHSNITFPSTSPTIIQQILIKKIRELTLIFQSINFKLGSRDWPVLRPHIVLPASCATQLIFLYITDLHFSTLR
jgi:hypothetical protein